MKSRKLKNAMLLNVVLVGLIVWTQVILTLRPESAGGFEAMMIAWVGSFLVNNGFYFLANVGQKVLLSRRNAEGEKNEQSQNGPDYRGCGDGGGSCGDGRGVGNGRPGESSRN